ncbi:MAG: MFS transporter [Demequinaceae bacterium]|nr:MFS transporter [Demequinaceae bacterium]
MSALTELRHLLRGVGFRRLAGARLLSQLGDGMFQAGLAAYLFFNPTEATTAAEIALGFLLLFAPFTLVGPFVGPLIDRWQRQRIILVGNVVRLVLAGLLGYLIVSGGPDALVYVVALLTLSLNRFLLAAMTAAIPRVVADEDLLTANAILPTLGTLAALLGAGVGVVVTFFAPGLPEHLQALAALSLAGVAFGLSSWVTTTIGRTELGPIHPLDAARMREHLRDLVRGLRSGARYLARRVTPLHALLVMAAQRFLYGLMFVASIIISREILAGPTSDDGGLGDFGTVLVAAGIGFALAAILTPALGHRISRHGWVVACLLVGSLGQGLLALSSSAAALLSAAIIVSFAVQGGKIAIDTIVQRDTEDEVRGRAFILYDMAYNVAIIVAAAVCAFVLPDNGYSVSVMATAAVAYLVLALLYALAPREPHAIEAVPSTR